MAKIRIMLADDHTLFRQGIRTLISAEADMEVVGEAATALRAIQRNWAFYGTGQFRRAKLIEARLPPLRAKPHPYPNPAPAAPLGSWTLLDANTLIASGRCSSPFAHGEVTFVEDKATPPNRAYLKLWELFTLLGTRPKPGELCIDLGASPGGWSWVLHETGASVLAVDKAPLAPAVAALAAGFAAAGFGPAGNRIAESGQLRGAHAAGAVGHLHRKAQPAELRRAGVSPIAARSVGRAISARAIAVTKASVSVAIKRSM
mgnify:CR=1 FL=1